MSFSQDRVVLASNFIERHGRQKFLDLLERLRKNEPPGRIASDMNVGRQTVHVWRRAFGEERRLYILHPEIEELITPVYGRAQV